MQDLDGWSPVFRTTSEKIVEEMLKLHDLELVNGNGRQLLERGEDHFCCQRLGALTEVDIVQDLD